MYSESLIEGVVPEPLTLKSITVIALPHHLVPSKTASSQNLSAKPSLTKLEISCTLDAAAPHPPKIQKIGGPLSS